MSKNRILVAVALFLVASVSLSCQSASGVDNPSPAPKARIVLWETVSEGQIVTLEFQVRRVGSDPFSRLVLTDTDGYDWNIDAAGQVLLKGYEQKKARVEGVLHLESRILANGKKLSDVRELRQIKILN